jgi:hypothetical protein
LAAPLAATNSVVSPMSHRRCMIVLPAHHVRAGLLRRAKP